MAQLANSPPSSAAFYKESSFAPVAPLPIQPNIFHALVTPEMASVVHGWAKLNSRARSFCGPPTWWEVPRFGSFSVTFPGHEQGSEWEVENLGHNPAPIWAPGTCKARIYPLGYCCRPRTLHYFNILIHSHFIDVPKDNGAFFLLFFFLKK